MPLNRAKCLFLLPALFLAQSAWGIHFALPDLTADSCSLRQNTSFHPGQNWISGVSALSASVSFRLNNKAHCSGAYVSDAGHILTASHCLESCVFDKAGKRKQTGPEIQCDFTVNGQNKTVRVLLMASCSVKALYKLDERLQDPSCLGQPDVAVVQPLEPEANFSCLGTSPNLKPGDRLLAFGYPQKTRRGKYDSDGESLFLSAGRALASTPGCTVARDSYEGWRPGDRKQLDSKLLQLGKDFVQSTLDAVPGSSGSPVINEEGELVGVMAFTDKSVLNAKTECRGGSFFTPYSAQAHDRAYLAPGFSLDQIRCEKKRMNGQGIRGAIEALEKD